MSRLLVLALILAPLTTCAVQTTIAWRGRRHAACCAWAVLGLLVASCMAIVAHHTIAP